MATQGRLGAVDLAATTLTLLYTCPSATKAFVAVNMCARSGSPTVRLALSQTSSPDAVQSADYLEYDFALSAGGIPLLREGIIMNAGDRLFGYASAANVSAVVYGQEEAA